MATLFERLIGTNEDEQRIPIHAIQQLLMEARRGAITAQTVISAYSLTAQQQTDLQTIFQAINGASNKPRYFEFVFSMLALGEIARRGDTNGALDVYLDEATFWNRIGAHG